MKKMGSPEVLLPLGNRTASFPVILMSILIFLAFVCAGAVLYHLLNRDNEGTMYYQEEFEVPPWAQSNEQAELNYPTRLDYNAEAQIVTSMIEGHTLEQINMKLEGKRVWVWARGRDAEAFIKSVDRWRK